MSTYLLAIAFAGASSAVAISALYPALGALLGYLVLGDRLGSRGWAGVVLAVSGATLASYAPPAGASPHYLLGALCAVASATGWAVEGVLVARSLSRMPALAALNIREGVSALVFLALVLPLFGAAAVTARTVASPTIAILVVASLCGAGAYLLYYRSLDLLGPSRAMRPTAPTSCGPSPSACCHRPVAGLAARAGRRRGGGRHRPGGRRQAAAGAGGWRRTSARRRGRPGLERPGDAGQFL